MEEEFAQEVTAPSVLFDLLENKRNVVSSDKYFKLREMLSEHLNLFNTVQKKEKDLLKQAKKLYDETSSQQNHISDLEKIRGDNSVTIADFLKEKEKIENKMTLIEEQESNSLTKLVQLERQRDYLELQKKKMIEEREALEKPIIEKLSSEIEDLKLEVQEIKGNMAKIKDTRQQLQNSLEIAKLQSMEDANSKKKNEAELRLLSEGPEKEKKLTHKLANLNSNLQMRVSELEKEISGLDSQIQQMNSEKQSIHSSITNSQNQEANLVIFRSQKLKEVDALLIESDVKLKKIEKDLHLERLAAMKELEGKISIIHSEKSISKTIENEIEKLTENLSQLTLVVDNLQTTKEHAETTCNNILLDKQEIESKIAKMKSDIVELSDLLDAEIFKYINTENANAKFAQEFQIRKLEMDRLDHNVHLMMTEERKISQQVLLLTLQIEEYSRQTSKYKRQFIEAVNEVKVKSFINKEMVKQVNELNQRKILKQQLYQEMKQDRNKKAKALQHSVQTLNQTKEKIKILESEHEVLLKQFGNSSKQLTNITRKLTEGLTLKMNLESEKSKLLIQQSSQEKKNVEHIMEIEKLNSVINKIEEDMLHLKERYEVGVQERNNTGIRLIDRNDELCILYEKANMQEEIVKNGEVELNKKEQDIRMLDLELKDLERQVRIYYEQVPEYETAETEKDSLIQEISKTEKEIEDLSVQLEDPSNDKRWRNLPGPTATHDELKEKIDHLENSLNSRKEQLMEKNIVLQELTKSSDKLRKLAISGRGEAFDLACNIREVEQNIRDVELKLMSYVAEISIYSANALNFEEQNKELTKYVEHCKERFAQNLPPSEQMEKEWQKFQELEQKRIAELFTLQEKQNMYKDLPATVTRTTALKRPTSYLDEVFGLPKPYMFQPMMWSEPGSTMRHMRKTGTKEIQIKV